MCISPILIKNPYWNHSIKKNPLNKLHDTTSTYIQVPCGHCPDCVHLRQAYLIQRAQLMAMTHHLFMCTLTYDNKYIPRYDIGDFHYKYVDRKDLQNFFKRIRNHSIFGDRRFSYICVSEYGGRTHRPHVHILFFLQKLEGDNEFTGLNLEAQLYDKIHKTWCRNYGTRKHPKEVPLSRLVVDVHGRSTYDFHYCDIRVNGYDDVVFYVTKYVLKVDPYVNALHSALKLNYEPEEYRKHWNVLKPKFYFSKNFGSTKDIYDSEGNLILDNSLQRDYVDKCISMSDDCLNFFSPDSGFSSPLSPYLRTQRLSIDDAFRFKRSFILTDDGQRIDISDGYREVKYIDEQTYQSTQTRFERISKQINDKSIEI